MRDCPDYVARQFDPMPGSIYSFFAPPAVHSDRQQRPAVDDEMIAHVEAAEPRIGRPLVYHDVPR